MAGSATTGPRRATLAKIGQEASVSMSTVSKVLNGRAGVSGKTRALVEDLLDQHGYTPRSQATAWEPYLELVMSEVSSQWSTEIIRGAQSVAQNHDLSLTLVQSGDRFQPAPDWIEGVLRRRPYGVVLVLSTLSQELQRQLRTRGIPFVLVDPSGEPSIDVPAVGAANFDGGLLAGRHLIELGHTRIGVVGGPEHVMSAKARIAGVRAAMESAGIPLLKELVLPGDYHLESGASGAEKMLSMPQPPTAIFALSDLAAFGVYKAARKLGVSVPEQLSVLGFDDVPGAEWAGPPLTTVRQPLTKMAEESVRMLIRIRTREPGLSLRLDLATTLVVRESTDRIS
jgi:LacI family transcriptional regulator, xylobiose transport system transcriptional regulator